MLLWKLDVVDSPVNGFLACRAHGGTQLATPPVARRAPTATPDSGPRPFPWPRNRHSWWPKSAQLVGVQCKSHGQPDRWQTVPPVILYSGIWKSRPDSGSENPLLVQGIGRRKGLLARRLKAECGWLAGRRAVQGVCTASWAATVRLGPTAPRQRRGSRLTAGPLKHCGPAVVTPGRQRGRSGGPGRRQGAQAAKSNWGCGARRAGALGGGWESRPTPSR